MEVQLQKEVEAFRREAVMTAGSWCLFVLIVIRANHLYSIFIFEDSVITGFGMIYTSILYERTL